MFLEPIKDRYSNPMAYLHSLRIRYGELDPQGVVFNANYLAFCDDAMDCWVRGRVIDGLEVMGYDLMLKKAVIEWHAPARLLDMLEIKLEVSRWGDTSFDVTFDGRIRSAPCFTATITYVSVRHGTSTPTRLPDEIRGRLH
jgi:acyl-CoA thioester hydrolase